MTICLGLAALIKKSIGLKNIPPPIPTTPEINPNIEPIKIETIFEGILYLFSSSSYDLKFNKSKIPAIIRTENNKNSKIFFSTGKVPPIYAKGIEPIKNGINNLKFMNATKKIFGK